MKAYLFYDLNEPSQEATSLLTEELARLKIDAVNMDASSRDGSPIAELYDVTRRPAAVLTRDDGSLVRRWLGTLPPATTVSYYVNPV